jgi:phosphoribosylaminoimidazolecarboxamide formyltransferase/IMP cyclohydrolase
LWPCYKKTRDAYNVALACDPTSAFGGVIANTKIDVATAIEINKLFFAE